MIAPDRIKQLTAQSTVTGIDFIAVHTDQLRLTVHFYPLPGKSIRNDILNDIVVGDFRIYDPQQSVQDITVSALNWGVSDNELELAVSRIGDFTNYRLRINDHRNYTRAFRIDPFYNDALFSFKANCPSDLDCKPAGHECAEEPDIDFQIDYQARDFWSFRKALLDFASLRYPEWVDRLEADQGVMLAEVMSALGDEMSYFQDRLAREAFLETATQKRSIRRHAKLVDYDVHESVGSQTWLRVIARGDGNIPAGFYVWAESDNGTRFDFEVGRGLEETLANKAYPVRIVRNRYNVFIYNDDYRCMPFGEKKLWIQGHHKADIESEPGFTDSGKWMLLATEPQKAEQPTRRHLVNVTAVEEMVDPIQNVAVTLLRWDEASALPFEMDLLSLVVYGNLIPATAGRTMPAQFANETLFITGRAEGKLPPAERDHLGNLHVADAIQRQGANETIRYLFTLPSENGLPLVWLRSGLSRYIPEIHLQSMRFDPVNDVYQPDKVWQWTASFLDDKCSSPSDLHYTLDEGNWGVIARFERTPAAVVHRDYANDRGMTIRFGDGEFGMNPADNTVFRLQYRLGGGLPSNVPEFSINNFQQNVPGSQVITAIANPFAAEGGADAETAEEVRNSAPQAFKAITFRAVRQEDYAEAAERLPWVQKAGASFRWTGSWLSALVTPDPKNAVTVSAGQGRDLLEQLDRFRQAGRPVVVLNPLYADLDLEIEICAEPHTYAGEVKARVLKKLFAQKGVNENPGFFSPDNFTFGDPLHRSALEAFIQNISGVMAIDELRIQRRGYFKMRPFSEFSYAPGTNSIIRVENDALHPGRGSVKIYVHGGA